MATLKRLISFADVTARTVVNVGSEAHKFDVAIPNAERRHLRPVLGSLLYSDLLNFVQQATPDTDDPLAELAEQVKGMLAAWSVVVAWPSLLGHIEAAGFNTKVGNKADGTSRADVELAELTIEDLRDTAAFESSELLTWLAEHAADYPSWVKPGGTTPSQMPLGGLDLD